MLQDSKIALKKEEKHQLNNQGCKCQMCQKLIREETMRIVVQNVVDRQSESFGYQTKQYYLKIINKMMGWEKKPRKLRFALPEICVYENHEPVQLYSKKLETSAIKQIHDKTKMHMFQIIQYFFQGFVYHNPDPTKKSYKKRGSSFSSGGSIQKYRNQCVVIAKYQNNNFNMLTLAQMEWLFKSRYKSMRDGLLYLQTLVCTKDYKQIRINLNLKEHVGTEIYERARTEVKILHEQLKSSDLDYFSEQQEIKFQNELKQKSMKSYFQYLTLKMVLAVSKYEQNTISEGIFKYVHNKSVGYLIDVRVTKLQSSEFFWATAAMKAFQYRLSRRMSMMDAGSTYQPNVSFRYFGSKAADLSVWLEKSTQNQWDEMKIIRTRLQRLEKEKKSLIQSQSATQTSSVNKSFKIRSYLKH